MRLQNRIGKIPHEPNHKVHVSADIGWNDSTFLIFFQVIGQVVHIIDCYEKNKEPIAHFAKLINSKDYNYGHFYGPHDLAVHEQQSGTTRLEFWHQLGIDWELVPNVSILDGIEAARCMFSKLYIDEEKCGILIKCLENYQQDYDEKRDYFKDQILKSKYNHGADAFRYMALGLPKTQDSMSAAELQQRYQSVVYGDSRGLPERFSDKFVKRF